MRGKLTEHGKMAKNSQFQAHQIVGMNPILRCLPNESALASSGGGITPDRMSASSDEVIKLGQFDDDPIIVVLVERSFLKELLHESGLQWSFGPFLS